MARADMESAGTAAPIATSGKREAAGEVIGVKRCGGDPVGHDERSISWQVVAQRPGGPAIDYQQQVPDQSICKSSGFARFDILSI